MDFVHVDRPEESDVGQTVKIGSDLKHYYLSMEWDLISAPAHKSTFHYAGSEKPFAVWNFKLVLRRKFLFYLINLIIPLVSHAFLTILVFYLPSASKEKVSLCINIMLSLIVYFLMLSETIPPSSLLVPLMAKYLIFTMLLVTISVIATAVTLNVHFRSNATHIMPDWVRKVSAVQAQPTLEAQAQRTQMEPACCCEQECSHWMQTTSKELPANLHVRVQCGLGITWSPINSKR